MSFPEGLPSHGRESSGRRAHSERLTDDRAAVVMGKTEFRLRLLLAGTVLFSAVGFGIHTIGGAIRQRQAMEKKTADLFGEYAVKRYWQWEIDMQCLEATLVEPDAADPVRLLQLRQRQKDLEKISDEFRRHMEAMRQVQWKLEGLRAESVVNKEARVDDFVCTEEILNENYAELNDALVASLQPYIELCGKALRAAEEEEVIAGRP